jgi:hypothetical protein
LAALHIEGVDANASTLEIWMKDISASIIVLSGAICIGLGGLSVAYVFAMFIGTVVMAFGILGWLGIPRSRGDILSDATRNQP